MSQNLTTVSFRASSAAAKSTRPKSVLPQNGVEPAKKDTQTVHRVPGGMSGTTKATTQKMSPNVIKVGVWDLQSNEFTEFAPPENTESLFNGPPSESVIGGDGRKMVPKKQLMPGGKYRAIVKLFLRFAGQPEGSSWAMATGWLIENDLLVTAGHCAYDWSHNYGRLTHVKAYIGYSGKDSVKDTKQVQLRMGIRVATTDGWLTKGTSDSRGDVSFIRVNKPFTGITPFKYLPTPLSENNVRIGVVGYPGDLMKKSTGEKGALMYEMYLPTNYSLEGSKAKMLQYTIDTFGGNSGSPVIRRSDMTSIGVHVLGGNPNSASVISGKYGNSFEALKTALKVQSAYGKGAAKVPGKGIRWVSVPKSAISGTHGIPKRDLSATTGEAAESTFEASNSSQQDSYSKVPGPARQQPQPDEFTKALKKAIDVTTDPLGAIAAYGLHVAGMRVRQLRSELEQEQGSGEDGEVDADEAADEAGDVGGEAGDGVASEAANEALDEDASADEAEMDGDETGEDEADVDEAADSAYEGVAERAMLTEAAFATLVQLGPEKCQKLGYLDHVKAYVGKYGRTCGRAGTIIFPGLMAPALRATVVKLKQQAEARDSEAQTDPAGPIAVEDASATGFGPRLDANKEAIIEELTRSIEPSGSEAFDGNISEILSKGLRIPGAIIANVAETDLGDLVQHAESALDLETNLEAALDDQNSTEYLYDGMAQRALIGEAMIEAILNTPMESQREEGIFSWIAKAVKKASPVIKDISPWVSVANGAYTVAKIIYKAAKNKKELGDNEDPEVETGDESTSTDENDWNTFFSRQAEAAVMA